MKKIYIFGAGDNGIRTYELLNKYGIEIEAFIDNDRNKQRKQIFDKNVISVERAVENGATADLVLVTPIRHNKIIEQLEDFGFLHVRKIPYIKYIFPEICEEGDYKDVRPFNHYESPYPNLSVIHKKETEIFNRDKQILDIDLNVDRQLELAEKMKDLDIIDWPIEKFGNYRYYYKNGWFGKGSADILYYMMKILKPKRIIEIGSGFSTAVMLDTNERCCDNNIKIISIEPYADRLKSLLKPDDNIIIKEQFLQDIPVSFFEQLEENDILFVDSSHVSNANSDVNYLFFEILPRLKGGVSIHLHDIFYPFIYPKKLIYSGTNYSEMYILRAFMMNNNQYSIQFWGEMLDYKYRDRICEKLIGNCSGSIWIRKENLCG